jgi:hypothetical protein
MLDNSTTQHLSLNNLNISQCYEFLLSIGFDEVAEYLRLHELNGYDLYQLNNVNDLSLIDISGENALELIIFLKVLKRTNNINIVIRN